MDNFVSTPITIFGKTYHVKAEASAELDELARFVDSKIRELAPSQSKTATIDLAVLTALNIAQDLFDVKEGALKSNPKSGPSIRELETQAGSLVKNVEDQLERIHKAKDKKR